MAEGKPVALGSRTATTAIPCREVRRCGRRFLAYRARLGACAPGDEAFGANSFTTCSGVERMSQNQGASGNKKLIIVGDRAYTTTAVPASQWLNPKQAEDLVRSGAAMPQVANYQDQFPWTKPAAK
jgi:ribosomal protein L37E